MIHTPHVANMPVEEWKKQCGCSYNSTCWLCYLGLRVVSSHGDGSEGSVPIWILKRLHLLIASCSTARRNKATPSDLEQASLVANCFDASHPTAADAEP